MRRSSTLLTCFFLISYVSFSQSLDSLVAPRVWLRADIGGITSNKWTDHSPFHNDAVAQAAGQIPTATGLINYNRSYVFDGMDDLLKIPFSLETLADFTLLTVFHTSDTTERGIWGAERSLSRQVMLSTRRALGPDTVIDKYGKHENLTVLSSVMQNWDNVKTTTSPDAFLALASAGTEHHVKPFKGQIAEFIVFNRTLSYLERAQYETYLGIKYGAGLSGGNYVSSEEKVLWNREKNAPYNYRIAGIGRDDYFALYQKQSRSAYDSGLLVMHAGKFAETNESNIASINNQDFILWGDNGLPLRTERGQGKDSVLAYLQRRWAVAVTGTTASQIATEIQIDISRFPNEELGYWLVIDRSGESNFSIDNIEYIKVDRISNGKAIYKVMWDVDGSGKDNFGFARARSLFGLVRKLKDPSCADITAGHMVVDMIAGHLPFKMTAENAAGNQVRQWTQSANKADQKGFEKGEYTLKVRDGANDEMEMAFAFVMPDALTITLGDDQLFRTDQNIVLDVSNQVPDSVEVSYRWENNFGFSSTATAITVPEAGIYRVFVTKKRDGCVFTDDVAISGSEQERVAVYPNIVQSNEPYNISVSLEETGPVRVRVINARGLEVQVMEGANHSEYQFVTSLKDPGLYVIVIHTPKGIESRKVIVN